MPDVRRTLAALLVARGFDGADADAFVARLTPAQVTQDLAWHDWESSWVDRGAPSTWPPEVRQQVAAHYLGPAHGLSPEALMHLLSRDHGSPAALVPAAQAPAGVVWVGVALLAVAAVAGYALAKG